MHIYRKQTYKDFINANITENHLEYISKEINCHSSKSKHLAVIKISQEKVELTESFSTFFLLPMNMVIALPHSLATEIQIETIITKLESSSILIDLIMIS